MCAETQGTGSKSEVAENGTCPPHSRSTELPKDDTNASDFDEVLDLVGSQGRYQKILVLFVLGPIIIFQPFLTLNALFMLYEPEHYCFVPPNTTNEDPEIWKNLTIPRDTDSWGEVKYSQCKMYVDEGSGRGETQDCAHGWVYNKTDYDITIPSQFNWVCDKGHYATDALTLYAVGNCVGALIFGWGADVLGRKPMFFFTLFVNVFFRSVSLFIPYNFTIFLVLQFLVGTSFPVMYITASMVAAEVSDKEYRGFIYAFTWVVWVVGMALLPLIAWTTRDWFLIGVITTIPGILLFGLWRMLPESPRWLLSMGRIDEAAEILIKIAQKNNRSDQVAKVNLKSMLKSVRIKQEAMSHGNVGLWTLFSRRALAKNTVMVTISWSINALVYYGITLNASNMAGNQFLNFFILAIIEVPAGWLGGYLVDKTGRRWTQVGFFGLCILGFIGAAIGIALGTHLLVVISIFISKFCITLTFLVVYLQGTEVFPTQLRSTGSGFASTTASAVGITGPYLIYLGKLNPTLPYIALTLLSLVGIIASILLPETLHRTLPETIEDANAIGKDAKFWSYLPHAKSENCESATAT